MSRPQRRIDLPRVAGWAPLPEMCARPKRASSGPSELGKNRSHSVPAVDDLPPIATAGRGERDDAVNFETRSILDTAGACHPGGAEGPMNLDAFDRGPVRIVGVHVPSYKNLHRVWLPWSDGLALVGANGSGKTNLLEAMALLLGTEETLARALDRIDVNQAAGLAVVVTNDHARMPCHPTSRLFPPPPPPPAHPTRADRVAREGPGPPSPHTPLALFDRRPCRGGTWGPCWSDGGSEFVECGGQPEQRRGVDCELVVATAQVLDEGVAPDHHARRSIGLQPAHRPEPGLESAVVAFDTVVLVLAGVVQRGRNQAPRSRSPKPAPGR